MSAGVGALVYCAQLETREAFQLQKLPSNLPNRNICHKNDGRATAGCKLSKEEEEERIIIVDSQMIKALISNTAKLAVITRVLKAMRWLKNRQRGYPT